MPCSLPRAKRGLGNWPKPNHAPVSGFLSGRVSSVLGALAPHRLCLPTGCGPGNAPKPCELKGLFHNVPLAFCVPPLGWWCLVTCDTGKCKLHMPNMPRQVQGQDLIFSSSEATGPSHGVPTLHFHTG